MIRHTDPTRHLMTASTLLRTPRICTRGPEAAAGSLTTRILIITIMLLALASGSLQAQSAFQGIGDLPGDAFISNRPFATADGNVIVGHSQSDNGFVPFKWTVQDGIAPLVIQPLIDSRGLINDMSAEGNVIVASYSTAIGARALVWRDGVVSVGLGGVDGQYYNSVALAVSDDGSHILGHGTVVVEGQGQVGQDVLLWTEDLGWRVILTAPGFFYYALGLSGDGRTVIGYKENLDPPTSEDRFVAYRWTEATGEELISLDPELFIVGDVSFDGSTVVGLQQEESFSEHAAKWTMEGGVQYLEELPGATRSRAMAISPDGQFIAGGSFDGTEWTPTLWEDGGGLKNVKEIIEQDLGVDLTGWHFSFLEYLSDDGTVVGGSGTNPDGNTEIWRADLGCAYAVGKRTRAECSCPVYSWLPNQGITFGGSANWNPAGPPTETDIARFETSGFTPVEFLASTTTNSLEILLGDVDFDIKGNEYEITGQTNCGPALLIQGSTAEFKVDGEGSMLRVGKEALIDRGAMSVSGGASFVARDLRMGDSGASTLNLDDGFIQAVDQIELGLSPDSDALFEINGTGDAHLLLSPSVAIGVRGSGILRVAGSSVLSGPLLNSDPDSPVNIVLGSQEGATGVLEIDGSGVDAFVDDDDRNISLTVGAQGQGTLNLVNGASLRVDDLNIGAPGSGSVLLNNGGVLVVDSILTMADQSGAAASVNVSGNESSLGLGSYLFLGLGGDATVTLQDGGLMTNVQASVDTTHVFIGGVDGADGSLIIDNGSFLSLSAVPTSVTVGALGRGDVQVTNGGRIDVEELWIGRSDTGYGSVFVGGAASSVEAVRMAVGPGAFGLLQVDPEAFVATDLLWVAEHGQIIGTLLAVGTWQPSKRATGLATRGLILSDGAQLDVETLGLAPDAIIGGTATWTDALVNGGSVRPGDLVDPTGAFTADAGYEQTDAGTLEIDLGGMVAGDNYDQLVVTGSASLDGTLRLTLVDDYIPTSGDGFTILTADVVSGAFETIQTPDGLEVEATYNTGSVVVTVIGEVTVETENQAAEVEVTSLLPNYPNPFSSSTTMVVELADAADVRLVIYDLLGREVATVFDGRLPSGISELQFDADALSTGTYVSRLTTTGSDGKSRHDFVRLLSRVR